MFFPARSLVKHRGRGQGEGGSLPCSAPHVSVIVAIGGKDYCVQHRKKAEDMVIEDKQ